MYRTVAQLDAVVAALAGAFPDLVTRVELPEPSVQGRPIAALRMRTGDAGERPGAVLVAGTHARELMNPDLLVELAVDLAVSWRDGTDLVLGGRRWSAGELRRILETVELTLLPCVNPDGRVHVMTVDDLWRKNRRADPGSRCEGVDLNRNADLLWGVTEGQTSCAPCSDVYAGPAAFSEPETRNVRALLTSGRVDCFADVHSFGELVLHPWGHAPTQTTDPSQRYPSLPSGTCAPLRRPGYEEWMAPQDLERFVTVADRVVAAIAEVRGRRYTAQTGAALYPTTGTLGDWAYGASVTGGGERPVSGFTFETGPAGPDVREAFHPTDPEPVKREAESGLLALLQCWVPAGR
jgi:murein tripeptide amidase MpaA